MTNFFRNIASISCNKGAALVEFAVVFPVFMTLLLGIVQLSLVFTAKNVVNYAAFSACRAQSVEEDPYIAASAICSPITGASYKVLPPTAVSYYVPGWGTIPNSDISAYKTSVEVIEDSLNEVVVKVTHDYELFIPFANAIYYIAAATAGDAVFASRLEDLRNKYGEFHYPITAEWKMYKPWGRTVSEFELHPDVLFVEEVEE